MKECPACRRCFPDDINHCPQDGDATLPSLLGEPILDARYQLESRIGQGGMGVVFRARHIFLKTQHAIKVILPDLVGNDPMLVTRFRQEALAAAAVRHQNIIAVTDFGVVRGTMPFLVMEFVNGRSLQEIMSEEGAMPSARAFELICPTAAGIAAAHRQNIVHRDLKPLNIMIQEHLPLNEGLKILDFGLAKIKSGELLGSFVQAKTSGLMGSPFYMAPEQWSDEEPDARADIYSLGVILYQMLAGEVPFKGSSIPSIMKKHLTQPPPTLQSMGVEVPPEIEAVVRHALEKEVSERTPSVESFLAELTLAFEATGGVVRNPLDTVAGYMGKTASLPAVVTKGDSPVLPTGFETNFDPHAGTISATGLDQQQLQAELNATNQALKKEQEDKTRYAREQIALDARERSRADQESARKRTEEEEKLRKEREEMERRQHEALDRVARQAEQLEEKLARLTTNIPFQSTGVDHGGTLVNQGALIGGETAVHTSQTADRSRAGVAARSGKSPALMIGVIVMLLVMSGGAVGAYFMFLKPKPPVANPDDPGKKIDTPPVANKPEMIQIPGGTFQMGRDNGTEREAPAHSVKVATFFMDKSEVTRGEYAEFIKATHHPPPVDWNGATKPPYGTELWPVLSVSLADVNAFVAWRSERDKVTYRLPTEEEWEYAARNGDRNDLFPWGNDWKENFAVLKDVTPTKVGSHPQGNNKWGVEDLIGNVWELTSSKISAYPGNPTVIPTAVKDWVIMRGGGFDRDPLDKDNPISSCIRAWVPPDGKGLPQLGFRLVRPAP